MAPRLIKTILYTLVSVNILALVLGGLVTWLSHSIPIRLRQFGLSPELTQVAGFSSLLIACLGLSALNFSSHYALNAYGLSCALFIVCMLFGMLPDKWRDSIKEQQQSTLHQQLLQANYTSTVTGSAPKSAPVPSNLVLDLIYCALLLTFGTLLVFALVFAQYLRRHELDERLDEKEQLGRSGARLAGGLCNGRKCTCDMQQATAITGANILGSLPNLSQQTSEDSLVPKYSSLSHSAVRWAAPVIGRLPCRARNNQHLRQNLSSRSLVSLTDEAEPKDYELGAHQHQEDERATSSLRHQAKRSGNLAPPALAHHAFYYASNIKDGASSRTPARRNDSPTSQQSVARCGTSRAINGQQAAEFGESSSYPQVDNSYRQASRCLRSINIDNTSCHCGSSVASSLAAKLQQPNLALDYQHANKWSHINNGISHASLRCGPYAWPPASGCAANQSRKQRRTKPSGASVMAMTAAAAAALFGGVVDVGPLEGAAGQGGADGMVESNLDECDDLVEDYAHYYDGTALGTSHAFAHHQHHQVQSQHEDRCDFDNAHHESTGTELANQGLVYAPPWDYGPLMSEVAQR